MQAILTLEDGFTLKGQSFTSDFEVAGEVIFNNSAIGYQEIITDPAYHGQILCFTWPLIGNYGINSQDMESNSAQLKAVLVRECCHEPSNWRSQESLPDFLRRQAVPGIEGIDTRALTRHIRNYGSMKAIVSTRDLDPKSLQAKAQAFELKAQSEVVAKDAWILTDKGSQKANLDANGKYAWTGQGLPLLVYDFGIKWSIIKLLARAGFEVLNVPPTFSLAQAKASGAKAICISHGAGNPATMNEEVSLIKELSQNLHLTGFGLGHQLIAQALGAKIAKMKFGRHGANYPVRNLKNGKVEISSQNSCFYVTNVENADFEVTHVNVNDNSCEGLQHKSLPIMSVQFLPEVVTNPKDTRYTLARFFEMCSH